MYPTRDNAFFQICMYVLLLLTSGSIADSFSSVALFLYKTWAFSISFGFFSASVFMIWVDLYFVTYLQIWMSGPNLYCK